MKKQNDDKEDVGLPKYRNIPYNTEEIDEALAYFPQEPAEQGDEEISPDDEKEINAAISEFAEEMAEQDGKGQDDDDELEFKGIYG